MKADKEYKGIFKSTFLFTFVQVIRMLMALIKNKIVAVLLGPEGMGIISIYNNMVSFIKTGAGLGIAQSAVRDVSEANVQNDRVCFSRVITITNRVVIFTSLLGFFVTVCMSPWLSRWGFGDNLHVIAFTIVSISVAFDIFVENQLAILKGMRRLRDLAKASVLMTFIALLTGVPLLFLFRKEGIVPSLVVSSISSAIISIYYVKKINYNKVRITFRDTIIGAKPMVQVGIALMLTNFLSILFNVILIAYIRNGGGISDVGLFGAGSTLVVSYFSLITTSLTTDYYPRVAACNKDNIKLKSEIERQSLVGLTMIVPLAATFVLLSPLAVKILYTADFMGILNYTDYALWGIVISIVSDCMGYILIAKQESKIYLSVSIAFRVLLLPLYALLYDNWGLLGLACAFSFNALMQLIVYYLILVKKYQIRISSKIVSFLIACLGYIYLISLLRRFDNIYISYIGGGVSVIASYLASVILMKKYMNIDVVRFIKVKFLKQ